MFGLKIYLDDFADLGTLDIFLYNKSTTKNTK